MRTLSVCLSGAVFVVSFVALEADLFEDGFKRFFAHVAEAVVLVAILAMTIASCWLMLIAYTPPQSIWWIAFAFGVATAFVLFRTISGHHYTTAASSTVLFLVTMALVIMPLLKLVDDNPYRVKSGQVVAQDFTPEHVNISCANNVCTTIYVEDDWALQIRNCQEYDPCRTGWLHFDRNVFKQYPKGSSYPRE